MPRFYMKSLFTSDLFNVSDDVQHRLLSLIYVVHIISKFPHFEITGIVWGQATNVDMTFLTKFGRLFSADHVNASIQTLKT